MKPEINFSTFAELSQPFSFYHKIFFKTGTPTAETYGESVYGRFLKNTISKKIKNTGKIESKFKIDAPRINGNNNKLTSENKASLFYHGIQFEDIDLEMSYPESVAV